MRERRLGDPVAWIFALIAAAWCAILNGLLPTMAYEWAGINLWYASDIGRVVKNMTVLNEGHSVTFKHPIFSIVTLPPTRGLMAMGLTRDMALAAMLALNAAIFTLLLGTLCRRLGLAAIDRALVLSAALASTGFIFWFTVPETFPFGATTLLAALLLVTPRRDHDDRLARPLPWALASFAATSMTITNIMIVLSGAALALWTYWRKRGDLVLLRPILIGGVVGMVALAAVAIFQDRIFGEAGLFFNPVAILNERQFVGEDNASSFFQRLQTLWIQVMVAAEPDLPHALRLNDAGVFDEGIWVDGSWPHDMAGLLAAILWIGLATGGVIRLVQVAAGREAAAMEFTNHQRTLLKVAALFLALNTALHLIYGETVFLYLAHFIGPTLLVTLCLILGRGTPNMRTGLRFAVLVMVLLASVANFGTFVRGNALVAQAYNEVVGD